MDGVWGLDPDTPINRSLRRYRERGFSHGVEGGNDFTDREYSGGIGTSSSLLLVTTLVVSMLLPWFDWIWTGQWWKWCRGSYTCMTWSIQTCRWWVSLGWAWNSAFSSDYQESYFRAKHVVDFKLRLIFRTLFLIKTKNYKSSSTETDNDGSRGLRTTMTENSG